MKRIIVAVAAMLCAGALFAAESPKLTLEEAVEKISEVISEPEKMGDVMKQLSADDQNAFLVEVNKAIVNMPGSNEAKTAKYLAVEREALLSAKKGNLQSLVATMFSTVTLESLTVLAERYGDDLFNRAADATKTFTDEQFVEIASSTVSEVRKECEALNDAAPRGALAVYLFERSSNGSPVDIEDRLLEVAISDPQVRSVAKNEWLAAAKGTGSDRFSALLGYAEAGRAPNVDVALRIAGPQMMTALLIDLGNCVTDSKGNRIYPITQGEYPSERGLTTIGAGEAAGAGMSIRPMTGDPTKPWNPGYSRSDAKEKSEEAKQYPYQD